MPEESGFIPSVSTGWGINTVSPNDDNDDTLNSATSQSWYVGLQWEDAFIDGNVFGMAVGQPTFLTALDLDSDSDVSLYDGNYAWEWWYKIQVTDNISVTPALYYLSRPNGHLTNGITGTGDETFSNFGGLVKTTFKF